MKVYTGTTWETPLGTRHFDVELTDDDGARLWPEAWPDWSVHTRFSRLQVEADVMVVAYIAGEGVVSGDWAKARITDLRARFKTKAAEESA